MTKKIDSSDLERTIEQIPYRAHGQKTSGKVRDIFPYPGGRLAIVVTDRVSVFDYHIGTIPYKGQVLNRIAAWWFEHLDAANIPHHQISVPHPNISLVRKASAFPVEFVIRAFLTGTTTTSSWYAYQKHDRYICGITMPAGMRKNDPFPSPISTPTTKSKSGHDRNISKNDIIKRGLLTSLQYEMAEELAFCMFSIGQKVAEERGLILVDTKYEMGITETGEILVIDEVHTPDSSRYWKKSTYTSLHENKMEPESLDKEFVRRLIISNGYDVDSSVDPIAYLTDDIRIAASVRYLDLYEQMTGNKLTPVKASIGDIVACLRSLESE